MRLNGIISIVFMLLLLFSISGCGETGRITEESRRTEESLPVRASKEVINESDTVQKQDVADADQAGKESEQQSDGNTATPEMPEIAEVSVSFAYTRMGGLASNQMALWVEDENGNLIKTVFVTNYTAGRRGYRDREMSLSTWVQAADPENKSDTEIDAVTSATPSTGELTYVWDMTDENGKRVSDGRYAIKLEGTLFWESNVLYSTTLDTQSSIGELEILEVRNEPDNPDNRDMVGNVRMTVVRGEYGQETD